MLSDSSLTNILTVSGVSQIRYRAYQQCYSRSLLTTCFTWLDPSASPKNPTTLITAYIQLINQNIPCMWQLQPSAKPSPPSSKMDTQADSVTLELWVFWFDDRHTGLIDSNTLLKELDELRMGSFTWENVSSKNTHRSNACTLVTVVVEYKLFVKAIRNLIVPYMLKKDALPLGEFFIFPLSYLEPAVGEEENDPNQTSSLLCCTYNIYLASTNLIFQPNTRRIRLRPLIQSDLHSTATTKGAKVLLSPSGEYAYLMPSNRDTTHALETQVLKQWSALLHIPLTNLASDSTTVPSLVLIRMTWGGSVYYPSRLVFVLTPTRQSPSALAGMNGTLGYNHGLTEDIAQKWSREMWIERIVANQGDKSKNKVDYWSYTSPRLHTTLAALDSISASTMNTPSSTDGNSPMLIQGGLLMKILKEPVLSSPLMASKSVATPCSPLPKDDGDDDNEKTNGSTNGDTPGGGSNIGTSSIGWRGNQTSLADFVQQYFTNGSVDDLTMQLNGSMDVGLQSRSASTPSSATIIMAPTSHPHQQQDSMMMTTGQNYQTPNMIQQQQQQQQQQSPFNYTATTYITPGTNYPSPLQTSYSASPYQNIPTQPQLQNQQQQQHLEQHQQQLQLNHLNQQQQQAPHIDKSQTLDEGINGGSTDVNAMDALDTMGYDMSTPWGGDGGLDNLELDLDVTEEDFNFFESEPAKPATSSISQGQSLSNMQSMDAFFSTKNEDSMPADMMFDTLQCTSAESATALDTHMTDLLATPNYDGMILDSPKRELYQDPELPTEPSPALLREAPAIGTPMDMDIKQEVQEPILSSALETLPVTAAPLEDIYQRDTSLATGYHASWPAVATGGADKEQRLVPPSFAPLTLSTPVNDAKYMDGGKFTYTPGDDRDDEKDMAMGIFSFGIPTKPTSTKRRKPKDRSYRPDYVPIVKKKRNKKKADDGGGDDASGRTAGTAKDKSDNAPSIAPIHALDGDGDAMMDHISDNANNNNSSNGGTSDEDSSSSSSSHGNSDSDSEDSGMTSDGDISNNNDFKIVGTVLKRTLSSSTTTTTPGQDQRKEKDGGNDTEDSESTSRHSLTSMMTATDGYAAGVGGGFSAGDSDADLENGSSYWSENLVKARSVYLHRLIGDVKISHGGKRRYFLDRLDIDYDTPFAATVVPGLAHPERYRDEDERSLHYLCQQAVLGGYPFAGGLAEVSTNGGEVPLGESTRVMITRRRDLIQHARGVTSHVPCLPCDFDRVTQDFKSILNDIFDPKATATDEPLPLNVTDFTSSVSVNGPLNVQQYYELSESNQIHSKYGKYQVKKRRPAEPNFDTLHSPDIMVSRHDEFIEGSPKMIDFWEKLRLEPYSAKKNISYFVVCPQNGELENAVQVFFKGLSTVYETCCLGAHHPGHIGPYRRGTVPVPLLPEEQGQSKKDRQLKSYMATCEQLGTSLGGVMAENVYIVIYMVNPLPHLSSHMDLSKCYNKLMTAFEQARTQHTSTPIIIGPPGTARFPSEKNRARLVMQIVPIEHVLRCTDFGKYTKNGLKEIAFSVYSKCPTAVNSHSKRIRDQKKAVTNPTVSTTTDIYAPPFVLTKDVPDQVAFSLSPSLNAPIILDQDATLHLAYGYSLDRRWMVVVWTDHRGELVEFAVLRASARQSAPFVAVFEEAWKRTKEIADQTDFVWTFVIVKLGLMFENELQAWIHVLPENERAAVISMDMESSLHVDSSDVHEEPIPYYAPDTPQTPQTPNVGPNHVSTPPPTPQQASSASTPSVSAASTSKNSSSSVDTLDTATTTTTTKILLLNHRVAYSRKRQRISEGVTLMDAVSDSESWILPLASGYLIQVPKQRAPTTASEEQFGRAPCVVELHLVYNQTQHSSYTTLRDIIKRYYALSYVNVVPSAYNCLPIHIVLAQRLWRLLLVVNH